MKTITTGSDFSGVGAFDYAIGRFAKQKGFEHKRIYACDWDKYARITYQHNHGTPDYYPKDVYEREIPKDSLDIYMTSPPCQSFSIAGSRKGKESENGVLFFNSHEFIKKNNPRYFIFENVKGLLSDDNGRTFQEWINYLGGKSINGLPVLFKDENAVDYHIYHKVLNSKKHGVPQNRERVFIIGIRDDADNTFRFPKEEHLTKKMKDILEQNLDDKYFLSDKMINYISKDRDGSEKLIVNRDVANTITCEVKKMQRSVQDNYIWIADYRNDEGLRIRKDGISPCMTSRRHSETDVSTMAPLIGGSYLNNSKKIRRLTPRECFRLQDFPDTFDFSVVSDSQAYKQAGNSITVRVLELLLNKLEL